MSADKRLKLEIAVIITITFAATIATWEFFKWFFRLVIEGL